jgi:cysteine desulfurase
VNAPVFLDHHTTTPVDPRVVEAMLPFFGEHFGNPASQTHAFGWRAEAALEEARESLARSLGASSAAEIVFTSGATESNNLALLGLARSLRAKGDHLISVCTEHPSVVEPCRALAEQGFELTLLPVDSEGLVDLDDLRAAVRPDTLLVSVMAANSEIGVLQPIEEIGRICREREVFFHSDATQAVGKIPFAVGSASIDLLSLSAHKLYGPKGIGALYVRSGRPRVRLEPLVYGGGQERGLRSGTPAVPLAVGFARALEIARGGCEAEGRRLTALRERLLARLRAKLDGVHLNGHPSRRLPGNLNVSFEGVDGDALLAGLQEIAVSSGSACTSAKPEPSHVLKALGLPDDLVRASLRFGLGRSNTPEQIDWAAERVIEEVRALRSRRSGRGGGRASA